MKKKKSKDYYSLLVRKKAQFPNIAKKLQSDFSLSADQLSQFFMLSHSVALESYVKAFQYKVLNSILYNYTKLCEIGFKTDDLCSFCEAQPETLHHFPAFSLRLCRAFLERISKLLAPTQIRNIRSSCEHIQLTLQAVLFELYPTLALYSTYLIIL